MVLLYEIMMECPRKKWLITQGVEGVAQFRKKYNETIKQYVRQKLRSETVTLINDTRIQRAIIDEEWDQKIDQFRSNYHFTLGEDVSANIGGIEAKAYRGTYNDAPALIQLSTAKKVASYHWLSLFLVMKSLYANSPPANLMLVLFLPADNRIVEFPRAGVLTKAGVPDKRFGYSGPWIDHQATLESTLMLYQQFVLDHPTLPEPNPAYGECSDCPYHNVTMQMGSDRWQCVG